MTEKAAENMTGVRKFFKYFILILIIAVLILPIFITVNLMKGRAPYQFF
ncbi:MAG TPA: hypothetical protein PK728_03060 [Bacillota bacterium]|nr:hypothetical protein [Bacillota bacterium]